MRTVPDPSMKPGHRVVHVNSKGVLNANNETVNEHAGAEGIPGHRPQRRPHLQQGARRPLHLREGGGRVGEESILDTPREGAARVVAME